MSRMPPGVASTLRSTSSPTRGSSPVSQQTEERAHRGDAVRSLLRPRRFRRHSGGAFALISTAAFVLPTHGLELRRPEDEGLST